MKVIVCNDYEEMSLRAAQLVASQVTLKPTSVLGFATGSTPVGLYHKLSEMNKAGEIDFSEVTTFNLDEYYPIDPANEQSYRYFMNENLFDHINVDPSRTHVPYGLAEDPHKECAKYDEAIEAAGGIDLQILGIGQNGHIGFNEPDSSLDAATHLTPLTQNTIDANSRFFESRDDVPTKALTMGLANILRAKKIIMLANGKVKAPVVAEMLRGKINTSVPASLLNVHPDVILICDREAYAGNSLGVDIGGTSIKFGVIDAENNVVCKESIPTRRGVCAEEIVEDIAQKCGEILAKFPINSVGVGTPGRINFEKKTVSATALPFEDTPLAEMLEKKLKMPVFLNNDANCAALGEAVAGEARDAKNLVMITLGTGIGGGIVIDKKIYTGLGEAGEIGHMCIDADGKRCGCGAVGCWERYASATALVEMTERAAKENPDSLLAKLVEEDRVCDGKTAFVAAEKGCPTAADVIGKYIDYLVIGIKNVVNMFSPDTIVLSGGLSGEGEALLAPLSERLGQKINVKISRLGNDAGIIGAALLCRA